VPVSKQYLCRYSPDAGVIGLNSCETRTVPCMGMWAAAIWGLAGGLCVEALDLYTRIRGPRFSMRRPGWYMISVLIRVGAGAILAAAAAGSHQVTGPLAALGLGVGAPLVIQRLAKEVPVTDAQDTAPTRAAKRRRDNGVADPGTEAL
jgi:hypothetical protein